MTTLYAFSLDTLALRSRNYLERMVDAEGLPYFNVFHTRPAVAAHDWPDFGDVMSRQYQGALMLRQMTGLAAASEDVWRRNILGLIREDGLLHRRATNYARDEADPGDLCLTLYALATACLLEPSAEMEGVVRAMVGGLRRRWAEPAFRSGFLLKSLLAAWRATGDGQAWQMAEELARELQANPAVCPADDVYAPYTHMHLTLRCLVGLADFARLSGDGALLGKTYRLYRSLTGQGTSFGFLPEAVARQGDIVSCETCALMDAVGGAVTLANAGHPELWGNVERLLRNQYAESQASDLSWLETDEARPDTAQMSWRGLRERLLGAWAGWSSPTHFLAAEETLNKHWGGPELRDKPRLFQNCCGGSGVHGLFIAWRNSARYAAGCVTVNLRLDKLLPQAEVRCQEPYRGRLEVRLRQDAAVALRLPDAAPVDQMRLTLNGAPVPLVVAGGYARVDTQPAGAVVALEYPLSLRSEEITIGNPAFQQYRYRVEWKGDTVVGITPLGDMPAIGFSDFDNRQVPIYYGEEGPGRLYQRQPYLQDVAPAPGLLHEDDGKLDLW